MGFIIPTLLLLTFLSSHSLSPLPFEAEDLEFPLQAIFPLVEKFALSEGTETSNLNRLPNWKETVPKEKRSFWKRRNRYSSNYADAVFRGLG